jgi:hypothetical protein
MGKDGVLTRHVLRLGLLLDLFSTKGTNFLHLEFFYTIFELRFKEVGALDPFSVNNYQLTTKR